MQCILFMLNFANVKFLESALKMRLVVKCSNGVHFACNVLRLDRGQHAELKDGEHVTSEDGVDMECDGDLLMNKDTDQLSTALCVQLSAICAPGAVRYGSILVTQQQSDRSLRFLGERSTN